MWSADVNFDFGVICDKHAYLGRPFDILMIVEVRHILRFVFPHGSIV